MKSAGTRHLWTGTNNEGVQQCLFKLKTTDVVSVKSGIDVFPHRGSAYRTVRFGLVTNHAATTGNYVPSRKALQESGLNLIRLFSPEHGLDTIGEDGSPMKNGVDAGSARRDTNNLHASTGNVSSYRHTTRCTAQPV